MKKEDFYDSKWDAREWTEEQKIKWQNKCFELGFSWQGKVKIHGLDADYYWLDSDNFLYLDSMDYEYFLTESSEEKHYEDMFPEQPEEKLDVVSEIVKLVHETQSVEKEEDSFEGLVQVITEFSNGSWFNLNKLSDEQKNFLGRTLPSYNTESWHGNFGAVRYCNGLFSGAVLPVCHDNKELTFNQVFKYKEA